MTKYFLFDKYFKLYNNLFDIKFTGNFIDKLRVKLIIHGFHHPSKLLNLFILSQLKALLLVEAP